MVPRKLIVVIAIVFVSLVSISIIAFFWKSGKNVMFEIDYPGASATISSKGSGKTIATVTNGSSLRLAKQTYEVAFTNPELNNVPIEITVDDKTTSIILRPVLSQEKKKELLASNKGAIDDAIKSTLKNASRYAEGKRELHHYGEWCTTSFAVAAPSASGDYGIGSLDNIETYYAILEKKDGKWSVVAGPRLIITKPDYPNIPYYIIDAIDPSLNE